MFGVANVASAVAFAQVCSAEAASCTRESKGLMLYWWLQLFAWATAATVRVDPNASDDLEDPHGGAAFAFWGLAALVISLFAAYVARARGAVTLFCFPCHVTRPRVLMRVAFRLGTLKPHERSDGYV